MLGIDDGAHAALFLGLGHDMERQGGLARRFRSVDLDHAAARNTADAERDVEPERAGRNRVDFIDCARIAQAHDGTLAKLFLDLAQRGSESFLAVFIHERFLGEVLLYYFI